MAITTGPDGKTPGQPVAAAADAETPAVLVATAEPELIRLPTGTVLTETQAQAMAAEGPVRLIVTAGAVACGKTTLLSSVYELFQTGHVKSNQFAGCDTFPAF